MSKRHGAREQKKLAKKKAKRDSRRRELARLNSNDPAIRLADSHAWKFVEALVPVELWKSGIGGVLIARRTPDGMIGFAVFMLDVFCLGVKDAYWKVVVPDVYDSFVEEFKDRGPMKKVSPEYLSKLVHCAADYAQSFGIAPHRDFRHARSLLDGFDPSQCSENFTFGQNGKPLYIAGPYDSPEKIRRVVAAVAAVGGHYIVHADAAELARLDRIQLPDHDDDDDDGDDDGDVDE